MATLAVIGSASRAAGLDLSAALSQSATGDVFAPGPDIYLRCKNTAGAAATVSVIAAGTVAGPRGTFLATLALAPTVTGTTGDRLYGPFPADTFADPSDGQVHLTYSATTGLTVGVYRVTN